MAASGSDDLAYMDHPFGADQFYGNYNSWENTKTWFAGVQQALGARPPRASRSAATATCSCSTATGRRSSPITIPTKAIRPRSAAARRCRTDHHGLLRRGGAARIHRQQQSGRPRAQPRRGLRRRRFPRAAAASRSRSPRAKNSTAVSPATFSPTVAGGALALAAAEAARIGQPRLPHSQLHRPLLSRPRATWAAPTCGRSAPGPTRAGVDWMPSARVRGDLTVFERRERDGIDYYRTRPTISGAR